ncbi:hypothetical protein ACVWZ6_001467 [Bradyrhizobium sp. GM6.1]
MPARLPGNTAALPEATRARVDAVADMLARERGGAHLVTVADLRERLADPSGRLGRFFADWQAARTAGAAPPAQQPQQAEPRPAPPAPDVPKQVPAGPPPASRGRPRKSRSGPGGSMVATAALEVGDERLGRLAKRLGQAHADGLRRQADAARKADTAPDLSTAAGRLRAALDGTRRPGAPERRRVRPADHEGAANPPFARAVAVFLCDRGRPARSREIFARFHTPTTYPLSETAAHALVVAALKGGGIIMTGAEWWFEGEEKPRGGGGDSFEELLLEAAKETLREAAGARLSAPEIEATHGDAHLAVRKGFLADALRREAARYAEERSRPKKKGTAAVAAVPEDGGIEKVGEFYRWQARRR